MHFHLNQPLLTTIAHLVEADVLIMAKVCALPSPAPAHRPLG